MMHKGTVLTTGANSGIGLDTAIEVARRGYRSVGSVRSDEKAATLLEAAAAADVVVEAVILDVTEADACSTVMGDLELYGLVNNAGYSNSGAIEDVSDEDVRHQLETMVVAPMRLAKLALPAMRESGRGRIVNVSSIYGRTTTPLTGWYQATKHALEAASDALRVEVAGSGIQVVIVEPGGFKTGIWEGNESALARHAGSRFAASYEREMQLTKGMEPFMGDPARVATVIGRALDSPLPRARYVVGLDAHAAVIADRFTPTAVKDIVSRFGFRL
jgi:NAD(P)-dependent dehydrogenase (short-subunit alcohol dehydrogenase family)